MHDAEIEAAVRALRENEAALLALPGVFGVGIGTALDHGGPDVPCLVVMAESAAAAGAVPATLARVPVFVAVAPRPTQQG